jgi:hypothetical protein
MSNVLNEEKQQQVLVLGRLGWSLRRTEQRTCVRRETASPQSKFECLPREFVSHTPKRYKEAREKAKNE